MIYNGDQKTAFITGASGGLGQAMTKLLAEAGYRVFTGFRNNRGKMADVNGAVPVYIDVSDWASVQRARDDVATMTSGLDVLINNAGVMDFAPLVEVDPERIERSLAANVKGPLNTLQAFLPMLLRSSGKVVNISSEKVKSVLPFDIYGYSKRCMETLSVIQRMELKALGLKLIIIRPGAHETPFLTNLEKPVPEGDHWILASWFQALQKLASEHIPKKHAPEDVAKVVLRAVSSKRPKRIYEVNVSPLVSMLGLMPTRMYESLVLGIIRRRFT